MFVKLNMINSIDYKTEYEYLVRIEEIEWVRSNTGETLFPSYLKLYSSEHAFPCAMTVSEVLQAIKVARD